MYGKYDIKLLSEFKKANGKLFNISAFCRGECASKGAIYYTIKKLTKKGLIESKTKYSYNITEKGEGVLRDKIRTGTSRRVVLKKHKSIHATTISFSYKCKNIERFIEQIKPINIRKVSMRNWIKYILYFEEETKVKINTKKIELTFGEELGKDFAECEFKIMDKLDKWINRLSNYIEISDNISFQYSHGASVNSDLAKFIRDKIGKFEKRLKNGKKVWVDYSTGQIEHETDDEIVRDKLEELIDDLVESKSRFIDIDDIAGRLEKVEKIIIGVGELEAVRLKNKIKQEGILKLRKEIGVLYE